MKRISALFMTGGVLYFLFETLWRGYSHWTMFVLGGLCFVLVGGLNEFLPWEMPLLHQMLLGGLIITVGELLTGIVVNLWLGWNVWDYTLLPGNLWGQICPQYSLLWVLLSGPIIILDDILRWRWYRERMPSYQII
ncbi:MAG: hypothetical protein VB035_09500 [Candidatus Fimivivens sp.]|nr:hypothetical protein [Candidatus Fimivivens sp.]